MALLIGNAQGFWGDSVDAPARLVRQFPDLHYLTLDYLAEVSMSILATQRARDPQRGYARDFLEVVRSLAPFWKDGRRFKLIANAGGLNPRGCATAVRQLLDAAGLSHLKVGLVLGDDVLPILGEEDRPEFRHLESGESLSSVRSGLVTANAYLGAAPLVEALKKGADLVITGRVADPSLTLAPCMAEFGWNPTDYDKLAGGTVAGHLIECGAQVCGGIATHWLDLPDPAHIGFPVAEVESDGSCAITKAPGTGGEVSERTVKEQLLYEIGDPSKYISPDLVVNFLGIEVHQQGKDRVRVHGMTGSEPTSHFKVSATYQDGYWAQGTLTVVGRKAVPKARRCGQIILERVREAGFDLKEFVVECLGAGSADPNGCEYENQLFETVLRVAVADPNPEAVERFCKELSTLITAGPQGVTGYAAGRPKVHPVFGYWPCLISKESITTEVEII